MGLHRRLSALPAGAWFRALSDYVVFLAAVQILALSLSVARVGIGQGVALGILLAAAFTAWASDAWCWKGSAAAPPAEVTTPVVCRPVMAATLFAVGTYLVLGVCAYVRPDLSWDGNGYHIPTMSFWARRGYVHWLEQTSTVSHIMNGYPKGIELMAFVVVRALRNSHLVTAANLLFLPLGVLGIVYMARALRASGPMALFAGCAFVLVPTHMHQAVTTYVDAGYAACMVAVIAAAFFVLEALLAGGGLPWGAVLTLGGAVGLSIAAKGAGLVASVIVFALLATVALAKSGAAGAAARRLRSRAALGALALSFLLACGTGGFWYARNYAHTGSPTYPIGLTVGRHVVFPGVSVDSSIYVVANTPRKMRAWPNVVRVAYTWTQGLGHWPKSTLGVDSREGGMGFLWLLGCLPALGLTLRRYFGSAPRPRELLPIVLLSAAVAVIFASTPMNWWARYTTWIYGLGSPCLALMFDRASAAGRARWLARVWLWACVGALVLEAGVSLAVIGRQSYPGQGSFRSQPGAVLAARNWKWPTSYLFAEMRHTEFDRMLAADDAVAVGPLHLQKIMLMGQLSLPLGHREIILLRPSGEQLVSAASRVRYVVWDDTVPLPAVLERLAVPAAHVAGFWLFTVRPGS